MKHVAGDSTVTSGKDGRKEKGPSETYTLHPLKVVHGVSLQGWQGHREGLLREVKNFPNQETRNGKISQSISSKGTKGIWFLMFIPLDSATSEDVHNWVLGKSEKHPFARLWP